MNAQRPETEGAGPRRANGWKWAAIVLGALVVVMLTCVTSVVWGGLVGYALGRRTGHRMMPPGMPHGMPFDGPYRPMPPLEPMPDMPDMPEMPYLEEMPWLGVSFMMTDEGALITAVVPDSPAEDEGLQVDDIITEVDGRNVTESRPLDELILRYSPGDRVDLTVVRGDREFEVRVRLASRMEGGLPFRQDQFEMPVEPRWEG